MADPVRVGGQFLVMMTGAFLLMTAFGMVLAVNAEYVIGTVYGSGWSGAVLVFEVLCIGAGVRTCTQLCDVLNIARGDVYALAGRRTVAAVIMVAATYAVREYGLAEAAWAITLSQVAMLIMTVALAMSGLDLERGAFRPFVRRGVLAAVLLIAVNILLLFAGKAELAGGMPLVVTSIVGNLLALSPVLAIGAAWFARASGFPVSGQSSTDGG